MEALAHKLFDLELDLKSTDWIIKKVKTSESYAQNLYAALCNNQFIKNEVITILKEEVWSCTWRYAGGLIADMKGKGDYMDYYCSGITDAPQSVADELSFKSKKYLPEGTVSDEIRIDLFKLGWIVIEDDK